MAALAMHTVVKTVVNCYSTVSLSVAQIDQIAVFRNFLWSDKSRRTGGFRVPLKRRIEDFPSQWFVVLVYSLVVSLLLTGRCNHHN